MNKTTTQSITRRIEWYNKSSAVLLGDAATKTEKIIKISIFFQTTILKLTKVTSLTGTGVIDLIWDEIGKIFSSSLMTTHALHDASYNKKRSLTLAEAS